MRDWWLLLWQNTLLAWVGLILFYVIQGTDGISSTDFRADWGGVTLFAVAYTLWEIVFTRPKSTSTDQFSTPQESAKPTEAGPERGIEQKIGRTEYPDW